MKRNIFISLLFFIFSTPLFAKENPKYYLSICAIFRNEGRFLKEWIEFHRMIGVEHFYLFNNFSDDNYEQVLNPYIKKGIVELFDWPYERYSNVEWVFDVQCTAYTKMIMEKKNETFWLAVIDIDEFIILTQEWNLAKFLKDYEDFAGLGINWQIYGTSNVWEIPLGKTVLGTLNFKCPTNFGHNHHIKSIIQPKYVKGYFDNAHCPVYKKHHRCVNENKKKIPGAQSSKICINKIRLNHYTLHDEKFYYEEKVARCLRWDPNFVVTPPPNFNQIEDRIAHRFLPALEKKLLKHR